MSKITALDDAIRAVIRPGITIHLTTQSRAATRAIQRLFRGQDLALTLVMGRVGGGHAADLVASGLVKRVIAGSYGAVSRNYTGPLAQVQKVYADGSVQFQHWSFFSLTQRLMAAALGMPFVTTHSLVGTSMAADNVGDYVEIDDPFGGGERLSLVRAIRPDVSFVHAIAADEEGNTIMAPPLEDGAWGPKASTGGAVVTVERIVSRDYIRRHSHLVRLPSRYVQAVCEAPFGAHPGVFGSHLFPDINNYEEDEAFNETYFKATRSPDALARWVDEWIYGVDGHERYLARLGAPRLDALRVPIATAGESAVVPSEPVAPGPVSGSELACTGNELLMTLGLRQVMKLATTAGHDIFLVGAGLSEVPGTAARELLREQGYPVTLAMGHGFYGFEPFPGRSEPDPARTLMLADNAELYGVVLGGRKGKALAILGAAQIDQYANLNSTLVGGQLVTGSGGSNDAASTADTIIVTRLSKRRLVERVDYVTTPGTRVKALITEKGVFEKDPTTGRLLLTTIAGPAEVPNEEIIAGVAANCGWKLELSDRLVRADPPTARELGLIRWLMPRRYE